MGLERQAGVALGEGLAQRFHFILLHLGKVSNQQLSSVSVNTLEV